MANSFITDLEQEELKFPLVLNLCNNCTHLQLSHAVNPDLLFKNYLYVSGTSQTLREYFDWFANFTLKYFAITPRSVLDIACNDGSQLDSYKRAGLKTYGIDPAENLYELSSQNHTVICDYFTQRHTGELRNRKLDIITAQNVFAHNSYPLEFLQICKDIMHDESVLFIQTSQSDMVKNNEFDTIYHEHLSFFNTASMDALVTRAGLNLIDVVKTPIHGNSYVFVIGKSSSNRTHVDQQLRIEREQGLQNLQTYSDYADKCVEVVHNLNDTIMHYRMLDYYIIGYGAAAKGMTLINFGELHLDYIIDDNPLKQGRYCPGSHIPVVSIDVLDSLPKNIKVAFVPLAWNFFAEIRSKIKGRRDDQNDIFIRYFPEVKVEE
jgi:2-polyprenyl-3-methyl-5-hydroxy-6-metoxy-1,4-benzoquinol methylase